jgi:hypothetical protein
MRIKPEDRERLEAFQRRFKAAADAEDPEAMLGIFKDDAYQQLLLKSEIEDTREKFSRFDAAHTAIFATACAQYIHERMLDMLAVHRVRRVQLEKRVTELEQRPSLKYCGTWNAHAQFNEGNLVTDHGSLWACLRSTRARPGESDDWQLAVKKGRDGR